MNCGSGLLGRGWFLFFCHASSFLPVIPTNIFLDCTRPSSRHKIVGLICGLEPRRWTPTCRRSPSWPTGCSASTASRLRPKAGGRPRRRCRGRRLLWRHTHEVALEPQAAKEILAEVFGVSPSEVEEMISGGTILTRFPPKSIRPSRSQLHGRLILFQLSDGTIRGFFDDPGSASMNVNRSTHNPANP